MSITQNMTPKNSSRTTYAISFIVVVLIIGFGVWRSLSQSPTESTTLTPTDTAQTQATATTPTAPTGTTVTQTVAGKYRDGSYTGSATDTIYGIVQVKAIVKNGQLADVQFLQYPNDRENSTEISNRSLPILRQEAIATQSASVDIVSGATQTSEGFQASLASALAQA